MADEIIFDIETESNELNYGVSAASVIRAPVDPTLTIADMAADAKAVGDALALKSDTARYWPLTISTEDWLQGTACEYTVADETVTANTALGVIWRNGSRANLSADLSWMTDTGVITLSTASLPTGTLSLTLIGMEVTTT